MLKLSVLIILGGLMTIGNQAIAQTATATPTSDPALVALQQQQAILDAKLKIQQDQQAMLTGAFPTSTATPNNGAFTVTGTNPFPSQKLAYEALNKIAGQIAEAVPKSPGVPSETVAVYDLAEVNSLVNFKAISKQLTLFQVQILKLQTGSNDLHTQAQQLAVPPSAVAVKSVAPVLIPGLAEASLKTAIDIIGLFRTNTNIAFSNFTADDSALTAAVVQSLLSKGRKVYQPSIVSISALDNSSGFTDQLSATQVLLASIQDQSASDQATIQQISDTLGSLIQASQAAETNSILVDPTKKEDVAKQKSLESAREVARVFACTLLGCGNTPALLDFTKAIQKKAECDRFLKMMASFATSTTTIATAFGALQAALMKVSDSGVPALTAILRAEKLTAAVSAPGTKILVVKSSVLGGSVVTRTNWWTGGHLLFTGGAIANFTVFNVDGSVAASGVVVGESGKLKEKF
jgi:hypothetical protein